MWTPPLLPVYLWHGQVLFWRQQAMDGHGLSSRRRPWAGCLTRPTAGVLDRFVRPLAHQAGLAPCESLALPLAPDSHALGRWKPRPLRLSSQAWTPRPAWENDCCQPSSRSWLYGPMRAVPSLFARWLMNVVLTGNLALLRSVGQRRRAAMVQSGWALAFGQGRTVGQR